MSGKKVKDLAASEPSIVSNYPRSIGISMSEKLSLVLRAMQLASGMAAAGMWSLIGAGQVTKHFEGSGGLLLCLTFGIGICTWQAWRATSKLESALGWRRSNTIILTLLAGLLTVAGGVLLYVVTARILHRHGIKIFHYWTNEDIERKIADLENQKTLQS